MLISPNMSTPSPEQRTHSNTRLLISPSLSKSVLFSRRLWDFLPSVCPPPRSDVVPRLWNIMPWILRGVAVEGGAHAGTVSRWWLVSPGHAALGRALCVWRSISLKSLKAQICVCPRLIGDGDKKRLFSTSRSVVEETQLGLWVGGGAGWRHQAAAGVYSGTERSKSDVQCLSPHRWLDLR